MDGKKFDAVTKAVATGVADRRTLLRRLAAGALGLGMGAAALRGNVAAGYRDPASCVERNRNCRSEGETCRSTRQCCQGDCEDVGGGVKRCGRCANIGAPCECSRDCCTFICAGRKGSRICANA